MLGFVELRRVFAYIACEFPIFIEKNGSRQQTNSNPENKHFGITKFDLKMCLEGMEGRGV